MQQVPRSTDIRSQRGQKHLFRPGGDRVQNQRRGVCRDLAAVGVFAAGHIGKLNAETGIGERRVQCFRLRGFHIQPAGRGVPAALCDIAADGLTVLQVAVDLCLKDGDLFGDAQCVQPQPPFRAGQAEPQPLISQIQLEDRFAGLGRAGAPQQLQRVEAVDMVERGHRRHRLVQHGGMIFRFVHGKLPSE